MEIELTQGRVALIDDEDWPLLSPSRWYARYETAHKGKRWAAVASFRDAEGRRRKVSMHRLLTAAPLGTMVDHRNGNTLDNRRANLRLCSNSQNQANTKGRGGSSRFKNVTWNKRKAKWAAAFMHQRKSVFVGYFDDEEEAARAVDARARELRGEFARLNFPDAVAEVAEIAS